MLKKPRYSIRAATSEDQSQLANLIHFDAYVHRHLDYRPPLDWIGNHPFDVLTENSAILAALACPPDPPHVAWLRLFAVAFEISTERAWNALWPEARQKLLHNRPPTWAAAIPLNRWFENLLEKSHFERTHSIVMLSWRGGPRFSLDAPQPGVRIRPMNPIDLHQVQQIDEAAFVPVWQNSLSCLDFAYRQAAIATVAELDGEMVGYQISTPTAPGGHLARLAVLPHYQGRGIGYAILHDLLFQFNRRGAQAVTVNTQHDNHASLALYQKTGFQKTGEEYPIYQLPLG